MGTKKGQNSKEDKNDLSKRIGNKMREIRKSMGLSMKQLAEETGLSPPLFSRIENGLVMPSIATLKIIADILKMDIASFFQQEEGKGYTISHRESRRIVRSKRGPFSIELLAEGMDNPFMEPFLCYLPNKDEEKKIESAVHEGQEVCYIIEGKMELALGRSRFILKKGDAAYWNGSIPHKGISLGKKRAISLNVHLIPGRRAPIYEDGIMTLSKYVGKPLKTNERS